jgi:nitrile hydratase
LRFQSQQVLTAASKRAATNENSERYARGSIESFPSFKTVARNTNQFFREGVNMEQIKTADESNGATDAWSGIVKAKGEEPIFRAGDRVRISLRCPIGHFRVPNYIRGKRGIVETVIEPAAINNEEEGYGRNAGLKRHYYRIAIPLFEVWEGYAGSPNDGLRIEVFETWLERSEI